MASPSTTSLALVGADLQVSPRLGIIRKPWRRVLPLWMLGISTQVWHLQLRQRLVVEHFVFAFDHVIPEEQKCDQRVNLVWFERALSSERHSPIDVIPHRRREWRADGHQTRRLNAHVHPGHWPAGCGGHPFHD